MKYPCRKKSYCVRTAKASRTCCCVMPFLQLLQDPVVRRLDPDQEDPEPRLPGLVQEPAVLGDVDPGLDHERLANPVGDDQVAQLLGPLRIRGKIVVAEEHDIGRDRLELLDHRFDRPLGVFPLLAEGIETERAELALERAAPRRQDRIERAPAEPNAVATPEVVVPAQGAIGKGDVLQARAAPGSRCARSGRRDDRRARECPRRERPSRPA